MKKNLALLFAGLTLGLGLMWLLNRPSAPPPQAPAASSVPAEGAPPMPIPPPPPSAQNFEDGQSEAPPSATNAPEVVEEERSTEKSPLPKGAPAEICQAPNAQEAWYRLSQDFEPKVDAKNFYFEGKEGKTLLLRQARKSMGAVTSNTIIITANWYDRDNKSETVPKELAAETRFLEQQELIDLAGPAWVSNLAETPRLLVKEEVLILHGDPDQHVTLRNGVASAMHLKWKNFRVDCGMNEPCACVPVKAQGEAQ